MSIRNSQDVVLVLIQPANKEIRDSQDVVLVLGNIVSSVGITQQVSDANTANWQDAISLSNTGALIKLASDSNVANWNDIVNYNVRRVGSVQGQFFIIT